MLQRTLGSVLVVAAVLAMIPSLRAQAVYTATRGFRLQAGAGGMYLNNDFTDQGDKGLAGWIDADISRYLGAELEAHLGTIISPSDVGENSYLIGPRFSYRRGKFMPYAKVMFGRGSIIQDRLNESSTYNIYAFGGGLDYHLSHHFNIRAIDVELQKWGDFEPHTLSPLMVSIGLMYVIR